MKISSNRDKKELSEQNLYVKRKGKMYGSVLKKDNEAL